MSEAVKSYFRIRLNDLRFRARIGVYEQERIVGNEFRIDLRVRYDAGQFIRENLDTSISYVDIYDIVRKEVGREWLLLESVAQSISDAISDRWTVVDEICITIDKLGTPITGIDGNCGIEYFWKKS